MRDNKRYFNRNSVHSFLVVTYLDKIRLPFRLTGKNICKCGNLKKKMSYTIYFNKCKEGNEYST